MSHGGPSDLSCVTEVLTDAVKEADSRYEAEVFKAEFR
jgi:hypothetical protein